MNQRTGTIGRIVRGSPATVAAIVCAVVFAAVVIVPAVADDSVAGLGRVIVPLLILSGLLIVVGLVVDGGRSARSRVWADRTISVSATELERTTSAWFAEHGWTAQRDEPETKVFLRRRETDTGVLIGLFILGIVPAVLYLWSRSVTRPEVLTIEIEPVIGGSRLRTTGGLATTEAFLRDIGRTFPVISDGSGSRPAVRHDRPGGQLGDEV